MSPLTTTGMRDGVLDQANHVPVGHALEELAPGAGMHGQELHARRFGTARELRRVQAGMVPAQAHLERDRYVDCADHGLDQREGMIEVPHQGRARHLARHLAGRAAHVDIDDIGAKVRSDAGAFAHPMRLAPGELYDEGLAIGSARLAAGMVAVRRQMLAGHHFRDDQAGAPCVGQVAECWVGHSRHRREQYPVGQRKRAYVEARRRGGIGTSACAIAHILGMFSICLSLGQISLRSRHPQGSLAGRPPCPVVGVPRWRVLGSRCCRPRAI